MRGRQRLRIKPKVPRHPRRNLERLNVRLVPTLDWIVVFFGGKDLDRGVADRLSSASPS
jgi:hypothetical protein